MTLTLRADQNRDRYHAYEWVRTALRTLGAEVYMFQCGPAGSSLRGIAIRSAEGPRWLRVLEAGRDLNEALHKEAIVERFYRRHQQEPLDARDRTTFDWSWWQFDEDP